ncbi:hypothetical protein ACFQ60_02545 [Streptomyces zhihengii]
MSALRQGPAAIAAELGRQAITLLDRHDHEVPVPLLRAVLDAAVTCGDGDHADTLLDRAIQQTSNEQTNPTDRAALFYDHANRLITRGETDQAESLLNQARQLYTDAGDTRAAAITWGRSPTSSSSAARRTRRCGSGGKSPCPCTSGSATPAPPP